MRGARPSHSAIPLLRASYPVRLVDEGDLYPRFAPAEGGGAGAEAEVEAVAFDRAADVGRDAVAVAGDVQLGAEGDDLGVDSDDAVAGALAVAGFAVRPLAAASG